MKYYILVKAKKETKKQRKVHKVMKEYKEGKLKTSAGKNVKTREQAIAIGIPESEKV